VGGHRRIGRRVAPGRAHHLPALDRRSRRAGRDHRAFPGRPELFKQGLVDLDQGERFGDITIVWLGDTVEQLTGFVLDRELVDSYEG